MSEGLDTPGTKTDVDDLGVLYVGPPDAELPTRLERANAFFAVRSVTDPEAALGPRQHDTDCVVVAASAVDSTTDFLTDLRERDPDLPVILVAGDEVDVEAAAKAGATDVITWDTPARAELLARRIEDAVAARRGEREAWETRQAARHELEKSRARFRALIEDSPAAVSVLDMSGRFKFVSPAIEEMAGYKPHELVGDSAFDYLHPEDRERAEREFEKAVSSPEYTPTVEFRFRHADGHWIHVESRGRNRLEDPAVEGFIVNTREITEYKRVQRRLRRERDLTERILEVSPQPIVVVDRSGTVKLANDRAAEQFGHETGDLLGMSRETPGLAVETADGDPVSEEGTLVDQVAEAGETVEDVTRLVTFPDGERFRLTMSGAPIESEGRVTHVVLSFDEITPLD